jgi:hypothetical protein
MAQEHGYTVKVHPRTFSKGRRRRTIFEDGLARYHSPQSYSTRREADLTSAKAMQKLIAAWLPSK